MEKSLMKNPIVLYDFLIIGKISDQLSHQIFFKEYDPKVVICLDGPLPYLLTSRIKQKKHLSILPMSALRICQKKTQDTPKL